MRFVWLLPLLGCTFAEMSWYLLRQHLHEGQMITIEGISYSEAKSCSINLMTEGCPSLEQANEIYYHFKWSHEDNQYTMSTKTERHKNKTGGQWAKDKKPVFHNGVTIERGGKFKVSIRLDGGNYSQFVRTWAATENLGAYGNRESPLPLDRENVKYVLVDGDCELTAVTQEGKNNPQVEHAEKFAEGALYVGLFLYLTAEVVESEMFFLMYNQYGEEIFQIIIDTVNKKVIFNPQGDKDTLMSTNLNKGDLVNLRIDYFRHNFTMELNGQRASFGKIAAEKEDGTYKSWKLTGAKFSSMKVDLIPDKK